MTVVLRYIIVAPPFCYAQLSTADYRKNTPKRSHLFRIFFQKNFSSLPGLFPKSPSTVPFLSNFFKKFYLFTTAIAKTPRKGHTNFKKIRKNTPHLPGLFPKRHPVVLLISEKSPKKHSPSIGGISKTTPCCAATFRKNSKKIFSTPLTVAIPPLFCYTLFQLFFKNFYLSTADYHFFSPKRSHPLQEFFQKKCYSLHQWLSHFFAFCFWWLEKVEKSSRTGIKSW